VVARPLIRAEPDRTEKVGNRRYEVTLAASWSGDLPLHHDRDGPEGGRVAGGMSCAP